MYNQIDSNKRKTTLLITIFLVFIIGLGWFLGIYMGYGYEITILAVIISFIMTLVSFYSGDKVALASTGAKAIKKEDNPYVYRMVENLAITAGIPMPKIHIIDSPAMNAFATGRDPEHASIALTTGLINNLENQELEGVIAHEMSHIKNYDIRVMMIVIVLVGSVSILSNMFFRARSFGFSGKKDSNNNGGLIGTIIMIIGVALLVLSPLVAQLIQLAISRKREYLADASGALLTRYPEGLASALEKISQSKISLKTASAATAHLFISNPFKNQSFLTFFSTHPPIEDRIKKLREIM
ncbi:MAG TPA: M48 family metallopeptidase [Candidatus Magasanikbacteria bacterium]|nr:M48 family metallopeptidase [Candidatus Magasanikbacteria bacterium]